MLSPICRISPPTSEHAGFRDVLLLGMGGSSLGPEVFAETFGAKPGFPALHVLDSTDPAQIRHFESLIDPAHTLFIVSSKSGSTLEPNIFKQYFFERAKAAVGAAEAPKRFVAITDPGSSLEKAARTEGFRHIFHGLPSIGGRYSVLSNFGMVPAAAIGVDPRAFLESTAEMARSCAPSAPPVENPGVILGAILGVCQRHGRDKATIIASRGIADFGAWLEQLLAESTGKLGKGIVPFDAEPLGAPAVYGNDRVFAYLRLAADQDAEQERRSRRSKRPAIRWCGSWSPTRCSSARNSSAGRWRPRSPARSSASTRSTSPMSRRARSRPAI